MYGLEVECKEPSELFGEGDGTRGLESAERVFGVSERFIDEFLGKAGMESQQARGP